MTSKIVGATSQRAPILPGTNLYSFEVMIKGTGQETRNQLPLMMIRANALTPGRGVGRERRFPVVADHLFRIAVVRRDKQDVTILLASLINNPNCLVGGLDGLDGRLVNSSVSHHVCETVAKVPSQILPLSEPPKKDSPGGAKLIMTAGYF